MGGTGAMGSHLANILIDRDFKVVITTRNQIKSNEKVEYRKGNAKNLDFLYAMLEEKWDAIIDFMVYSEDEFFKSIDLFLSATSQYVFLSSARVYNESQDALTEESTRLLDSSSDSEFLITREYSLSKARQENMLCSSNKKNWTIIRPYISYSEKRLQLGTLEKEAWLYRALKGRTIVFSEDIRNCLTTMTYGLDVAKGISRLIGNPDSYGETYHITNKYSHKWDEILDIYLNVLENELGKRPKVLFQELPEFLKWNPGKYQVIYDRLFDRMFDNTKINKYVNVDEFLSVESGLSICLKSFIQNPEFKTINWKSEAIKDRFADERTLLGEIGGVKQIVIYLLCRYFIKPDSNIFKAKGAFIECITRMKEMFRYWLHY